MMKEGAIPSVQMSHDAAPLPTVVGVLVQGNNDEDMAGGSFTDGRNGGWAFGLCDCMVRVQDINI